MTTTDLPSYPISLGLTVRDMQKSVAFYRDTLGFQLKECWPDESAPLWANLVLDKQSVMLGAAMSAEQIGEMCAGDAKSAGEMKALSEEFRAHKPGVGVNTYVAVPDVDQFRAQLTKKGLKGLPECRTQFYGLRELRVQDPDGYRFTFYHLVKMETCQSCSMPLENAQPGQMYCAYCIDEKGKLKPYDQILEGCINGYFIPMKKMKRPEAEEAAREMLSRMPAWAGRS